MDAGLMDIDAGLSDPNLSACSAREYTPECRGANDFACNFDALVDSVRVACQAESNCSANGWFAVELGDDGCVSRISLSQENATFAACAAERLREARCLCPSRRAQVFLGIGNAGCSDGGSIRCRAGEFACDDGKVCVNNECVPADAG
ncbi:MAG: hypothetical protein ACOY0T_00150 [Myxococcota bacterium]